MVGEWRVRATLFPALHHLSCEGVSQAPWPRRGLTDPNREAGGRTLATAGVLSAALSSHTACPLKVWSLPSILFDKSLQDQQDSRGGDMNSTSQWGT